MTATTLTVGELIRVLQNYPQGAKVYCNECGRYDDRREIIAVENSLGRDEVFLEYANV